MLGNMIDQIRIALYVILAILGFLLFQLWEKEHPKSVVETPLVSTSSPTEHFIPAADHSASAIAPTAAAPSTVATPAPNMTTASQIITVKTDLLAVKIDTHGGDIIEAQLLQYPASLHSSNPFILLNDDANTRYIAESGLLNQFGPDTASDQAFYHTTQTSYELNPSENQVVVKLNWQNDKGLKVTKLLTFTRGSYEIKVGYEIVNNTSEPWQGNLYTQLMRVDNPPKGNGGMVNLTTYFGAAISSPNKPFEKIPFKDMREKNLSASIQNGWAAMIQHYFISAWVPPKDATSTYYSRVTPGGLYTIGMVGQPLSVAPGTKTDVTAKLYTGPAIASLLEKTAPGLKLTIDYGWFWFISDIIFWMMQKIYDVVGNWGWSIVLVTVIIKLLFYQLSAKSYRSMSAMKRLQPKIEALKQRFGEDKQKFTQATLELYRQEKVNPMSGCLPILIQIPVFIALYWVLVESVQLRQAPFILWIHDLSQQDPYYILPILMGISMFIQQRLNPPPPDPMQAKVMMLMPVIFTVLFANFPAGLMLYWFVNNTLSFLQQWYIMRRMEHAPALKKAK